MTALSIAAIVAFVIWAGLLWLFGVMAEQMRLADEWELPQ